MGSAFGHHLLKIAFKRSAVDQRKQNDLFQSWTVPSGLKVGHMGLVVIDKMGDVALGVSRFSAGGPEIQGKFCTHIWINR